MMSSVGAVVWPCVLFYLLPLKSSRSAHRLATGRKLFRVLEQEGYRYAIRLKANAVLERNIAHLLKRPVGRPSKKPKVFYFYSARSCPTDTVSVR